MFSFYHIHPTSINKTAGGPSSEDGVTAKVSEMTCHQSIQHGSCLSVGAKLLHKARPKTQHRGLISSCLILIFRSSKGGVSNALLQGISGTSEGDTSMLDTTVEEWIRG